jgi:hypothetical protein
MSDNRQPLNLNVENILANNFLLADFMMEPEYRSKLEKATLADIRKVLEYFDDEKNVQEFASLFKSGLYKEYHNSKSRNANYDLLLEGAKEVTQTGVFFTLYKAVYNLAYNIRKQDEAVQDFVNEIGQLHFSARIEDFIKRNDL